MAPFFQNQRNKGAARIGVDLAPFLLVLLLVCIGSRCDAFSQPKAWSNLDNLEPLPAEPTMECQGTSSLPDPSLLSLAGSWPGEGQMPELLCDLGDLGALLHDIGEPGLPRTVRLRVTMLACTILRHHLTVWSNQLADFWFEFKELLQLGGNCGAHPGRPAASQPKASG